MAASTNNAPTSRHLTHEQLLRNLKSSDALSENSLEKYSATAQFSDAPSLLQPLELLMLQDIFCLYRGVPASVPAESAREGGTVGFDRQYHPNQHHQKMDGSTQNLLTCYTEKQTLQMDRTQIQPLARRIQPRFARHRCVHPDSTVMIRLVHVTGS
ncbi:hypothetical protein PsorP6_004701 [Peronosclerospora sorghi]|uniref:Uncharacterized protein n=1 Tax=Peronosclerospora sorghi TaxID=230839 RepID=A0ACC0VLK8_9STRA|nr:hypothetical protein PsorP6_004701 [Peronosclerospora sorghi]